MSNEIILTVSENKAINLLKGIDEKQVREFIEVVKRAYKKKPNQKDTQALRKWLDEYPDIWRVVFDLAEVVEENLINRMVSDTASKLAIRQNVDQIRNDFGYDSASMMEAMLIDNIVLAWLRWQWTEFQLVLLMGEGQTRISVLDFWERRLSAAQRRYLRACETLTRIRRLTSSKPAVQVNIASQGGQQVNVAGDIVKK